MIKRLVSKAMRYAGRLRGVAVSCGVVALVACVGVLGDSAARAETVEAQRLMYQLKTARMNRLVRHQPDLSAFLSGAGTGVFNADVTDDKGALTFSSGVDRLLWARATGRWDADGLRKDRYGIGVVGLHSFVTPNFIVGGMIEADYLAQAGAKSARAGRGAMAGSYFLARAANHPLYVEGRILRGRASYGIRRAGDRTQWPDSRRGLAQLKLSGQLSYGVTTLTPSLVASYATDDAAARAGSALAGQGVRMNEVKMGLQFRRILRHKNGANFVLRGGGALSRTSTHRYGAAFTMPDQRKGQGRVNLGVSYRTPGGGAVVIDSFLGGLGAYTKRTYGVKAGYDIRF
ncbi:hypothetical protein [Tateyamaria sp. ANG-S1]|uniref:hypothetical protein n=1 Tax=Tateyamaria sp. ANG-S1 TaxID=1577905 RepID=UPI00057E0FC1|nr:hypothetical protein [Tateyamaria sp. ANG-S1]KIC46155.1 hypothetical protein RA29_20230 [Tateyamaria sp. ANG-S1]